MDSEPSFDAADLADAILGAPPTATVPTSHVPRAPTEPITRETPVIPACAAPPPPAVRGWTDAQRALFALALLALMIVLIGVAAMGRAGDIEPPCDDEPGLFDDAERGLFDDRGC